MKKRFYLSIVCLLIFTMLTTTLPGCAKREMAQPASPALARDKVETASVAEERAGMNQDESQPGQNQPPVGENLVLRGRKLIREGAVKLKVKDVEQTRAALEKMVQQAGGFVSNVEFQGHSGSRTMNVTLRLPAQGFLAFLAQVRGLGFVENEKLNVIDVTDQYVDLDRRIATNQKLAARLEQLIQEHSYQFKDLLEVEKELARLQLETEALQGSMRGLDDRISLSTLTVELYQEVSQQIVPTDSAFAPLISAIENAGPLFKRSVQSLTGFISFFIRLIIVLIPWLIFFGVIVFVLVLVIRRARRKNK